LHRKSRSHMRPKSPLPRHEPYAWPSRPVMAITLREWSQRPDSNDN
jgi:hypothetical protein